MWFLYSLGALVSVVIYNLLCKFALSEDEKTDPIAYSFVLFVVVGLVSLVLYFIFSFDVKDLYFILDPKNFIPLLIDTACYTIAPLLYYKGLKKTPASDAAILYGFIGVYTLLFGAILGTELITFQKIIAMIMIVISITLVSLKKKGLFLNRSAVMILLSTMIYAVAAICDNKIINAGLNPLFFQAFCFLVPPILMLLIDHRSIKFIPGVAKDRTSIRILLINALVMLLYYIFIFKAYSNDATVSRVYIILSADVVLTVGLSTIFLKEREGWGKKLIASVLTFVGILLIA